MNICQDSNVLIFITKNGYVVALMMSVKVYDEMFVKMQVAAFINERFDDIDKVASSMSGI